MKPKVRRFDPWGGVTRPMIEAEAKHVAREMKSYVLLPVNDLKEKLSTCGERWNQADESLHAVVSALPEQERFAIQCLLVRDMMFLLELYLEYVRAMSPAKLPAPPATPASPAPSAPVSAPQTPFSEWLFDT